MRRAIMVVALLTVVSGEASAGVKIQRLSPPRTVVVGLARVAISAGPGNESETASSSLAAALRSRLGLREGAGFLQNGDLWTIDEGLRAGFVDFVEVRTGGLPSASEVTALAARNQAQALAVVTGDGSQTDYLQTTEARTVTVKDSTGAMVSQVVNVSCAERLVTGGFTGVLYDGNSGEELDRFNVVRAASAKDCDEPGDDTLQLAAAEDMIRQIVGNGAFDFAYRFVPFWEIVDLDLPTDPAIKEALHLAKRGDWTGAVDTSLEVLNDDPYNAMAVNLLGVAHELVGRSDDAYALYRLASHLRDDHVFGVAASRASQRVDALRVLEEAYGQAHSPGEWPQAVALVERAKATAATKPMGVPAAIKGSRSTRIPVFAEAELTSEMIAMLPGGTEVRRVRVVEDRAQIQLPDGGLGWVAAKDVR